MCLPATPGAAESVFKILLFMKRRPDMSVEAFRAYYEARHVPLCERYIRGVGRYMRRYIDAQPHPETGITEPLFDVITELWFGDKQEFETTLGYITTTIMADEITADEAQLFDRSSFRIATVVEHESILAHRG